MWQKLGVQPPSLPPSFFSFSPSQPAPSLRALAGRAWAERSATQLYNYELAFAVAFTLLLIFGKENLIQLRWN